MSSRISLSDSETADAVLAFRESRGSDPRTSADDPMERYLARRMWRLTDPDQQARIGERVRPGAQKALDVVAFIKEHGHTPRMNRAEESELGQWLITYARPRHREGRLPRYVVDILSETPEALSSRDTPDQGDRLSELRAFIEKNKRLPRQHVDEENSLAAWMYAQRPNLRKEGTPSHQRCLEVQELIAPYRGRNVEVRRESRIEAIRGYVDEHGHLPKASVVAGLEDEFEDVMTYSEHRSESRLEALRGYIDEHGHLPAADPSNPLWVMTYRARRGRDDFSARVRKEIDGIPSAPTERAERRSSDQRLADLRDFVKEHGHLPGPSMDGNLYRWMYYASKRDDEMGETLRGIMDKTPKPGRGRPPSRP